VYDQDRGQISHKKVIICINSIFRITEFSFDLVVVDECESLLKHTMQIPDQKKYYFCILELIKKSKKSILLDYNFGGLSLQLIKDSKLLEDR